MSAPSFGDNVCIVDTPITCEKGFAGERGVVYGVTTPSAMGIEFIGTSAQDVALNIHFASRNESFWFAPELVQLVDHGAGTEVTLNGVNKKWVRRQDGGWDERSFASVKRPWWKFWSA
jgi:hypothetical protein